MVRISDDVPDSAIKGRPVEPEWRKRRNAKRARRFVMVEWGRLVADLSLLGAKRAIRLYLVLSLHRNLKKTRSGDGWIELVQHDLESVGLADSHLCRAVSDLESRGLVEVRRRLGKRPLLRLKAVTHTS